MSIWISPPDLASINAGVITGLAHHLGVRVTQCDAESMTTSMPVDDRTRQPQGLLNGGASAALAEITAGIAGSCCIDTTLRFVVGQELNISHLRSAQSGHVYATARPLRLGRRSQVWQIEIRDDAGQLVAVSRLTNAILEHRKEQP